MFESRWGQWWVLKEDLKGSFRICRGASCRPEFGNYSTGSKRWSGVWGTDRSHEMQTLGQWIRSHLAGWVEYKTLCLENSGLNNLSLKERRMKLEWDSWKTSHIDCERRFKASAWCSDDKVLPWEGFLGPEAWEQSLDKQQVWREKKSIWT